MRFAVAADPLFEKYKSSAYEVKPGSASFRLIEEAIRELFDSHIKATLCQVFQTPTDIYTALGVSKETADRISREKCKHQFNLNNGPQIFVRKYFFIFDESHSSSVHSWTTVMNETLLFVDPGMTKGDLRSLLLHEFAISMDAKVNMNLVKYIVLEKISTPGVEAPAVITIKPFNDEELGLRLAFQHSLYQPASYAFSTMRAFNFESLADNVVAGSMVNHKICVQQFKYLFNYYEKNKNLAPDPDAMQTHFSLAESKMNTPKDVEKLFSEILNVKLRIEHQDVQFTFCQYMAIPLLSAESKWSFEAHGPRPRVTGGWNAEGQGSFDDEPTNSSKEEEQKIIGRQIQEDRNNGLLQLKSQ